MSKLGQEEVMAWFVKQRQIGNHSYHSITFVYESMKDQGYIMNTLSIRKCVWKLVRFGYLELSMSDDIWNWQRTFRVKDKYVPRNKPSITKNK